MGGMRYRPRRDLAGAVVLHYGIGRDQSMPEIPLELPYRSLPATPTAVLVFPPILRGEALCISHRERLPQ